MSIIYYIYANKYDPNTIASQELLQSSRGGILFLFKLSEWFTSFTGMALGGLTFTLAPPSPSSFLHFHAEQSAGAVIVNPVNISAH